MIEKILLDDPTDEMGHGADGKHSHIFAGMSLTAQSNPCFLYVIFAADIHFTQIRPRASGCVKVFSVIVCGQWSTAISDIQMEMNPASGDFLGLLVLHGARITPSICVGKRCIGEPHGVFLG